MYPPMGTVNQQVFMDVGVIMMNRVKKDWRLCSFFRILHPPIYSTRHIEDNIALLVHHNTNIKILLFAENDKE